MATDSALFSLTGSVRSRVGFLRVRLFEFIGTHLAERYSFAQQKCELRLIEYFAA